MSSIVDRALRLWTEPVAEGTAGLESFRAVYNDPLDVNGETTPLQVLVERARMLQAAFEGLRSEIKEEFSAPGRRAFAFRLSGRHVGTLMTPLGEIPPSGRELSWAGMDIFLVDDHGERIAGVWALADLLALLMDAGAITLR